MGTQGCGGFDRNKKGDAGLYQRFLSKRCEAAAAVATANNARTTHDAMT